MFEHTFDIGDIQLNPVNEYYSFGTAKFKGISAYDYIWKIADILSVQNVAPISEIITKQFNYKHNRNNYMDKKQQ